MNKGSVWPAKPQAKDGQGSVPLAPAPCHPATKPSSRRGDPFTERCRSSPKTSSSPLPSPWSEYPFPDGPQPEAAAAHMSGEERSGALFTRENVSNRKLGSTCRGSRSSGCARAVPALCRHEVGTVVVPLVRVAPPRLREVDHAEICQVTFGGAGLWTRCHALSPLLLSRRLCWKRASRGAGRSDSRPRVPAPWMPPADAKMRAQRCPGLARCWAASGRAGGWAPRPTESWEEARPARDKGGDLWTAISADERNPTS